MFQPAGVRTLLHIRSSEPLRPSTAKTRVFKASDDASALVNAVSLTHTPRPHTAPPTSNPRPAVQSLVDPAEVHEDSGDDEIELEDDPTAILANASAMLYQLQNTWTDDRRAELDRLQQQLQESYGFIVPAELLTSMLRGNITDGAGAVGSDAVEGGPEAAAGPEASSSSRADELEFNDVEAQADALVAAGAVQLASASEVRRRFERERVQDSYAILPREQAEPTNVAASGSSSGKEQTDAERLVVLRRQIERLKAKQLQQQHNQQHIDQTGRNSASTSPVAADAPSQPKSFRGGMASPEFEALNKWIEDMKLLASSGVSGCAKQNAASSKGFKGGSSPSRQAMAHMAESRAIEWASEERSGSGISPKGLSPKSARVIERGVCTSPSTKSVAQMLDRSSPTSLSSPLGAASSSRSPAARAQVLSGSPTFAGNGGRAGITSPSGGGGGVKSATELQLDDILHEFDEIDRVFDGIRRITPASNRASPW